MPLHHTQSTKQITFIRTNGGMAIPVDVTLTSTWLRPASITMRWGGAIPVTHTTIESKEYLYISQSDVKAHHAYLEKTDAAIDELIRALEKKCIGGVFAAEQTKSNHEQHKD